MISYEASENIVTIGFGVEGETIYISIIKDLNKTKEELIEQAKRELRSVIIEQDWKIGTRYEEGDILSYNNKSYKALQRHISQKTWTPNVAEHLFEEVM